MGDVRTQDPGYIKIRLHRSLPIDISGSHFPASSHGSLLQLRLRPTASPHAGTGHRLTSEFHGQRLGFGQSTSYLLVCPSLSRPYQWWIAHIPRLAARSSYRESDNKNLCSQWHPAPGPGHYYGKSEA